MEGLTDKKARHKGIYFVSVIRILLIFQADITDVTMWSTLRILSKPVLIFYLYEVRWRPINGWGPINFSAEPFEKIDKDKILWYIPRRGNGNWTLTIFNSGISLPRCSKIKVWPEVTFFHDQLPYPLRINWVGGATFFRALFRLSRKCFDIVNSIFFHFPDHFV